MACLYHAKNKSYPAQYGAVLLPELALCFAYSLIHMLHRESTIGLGKKKVIF